MDVKNKFCKAGCIFPVVVLSLLLHAEFGPNYYREDALYFICLCELNFYERSAKYLRDVRFE